MRYRLALLVPLALIAMTALGAERHRPIERDGDRLAPVYVADPFPEVGDALLFLASLAPVQQADAVLVHLARPAGSQKPPVVAVAWRPFVAQLPALPRRSLGVYEFDGYHEVWSFDWFFSRGIAAAVATTGGDAPRRFLLIVEAGEINE